MFNFHLRNFVVVLTKFLFRKEDWALGHNSFKFRDFSDISQFNKILSPKLINN